MDDFQDLLLKNIKELKEETKENLFVLDNEIESRMQKAEQWFLNNINDKNAERYFDEYKKIISRKSIIFLLQCEK
jgi:hypothetical protein